jgi:hypothetical protein
MKSEHFKVRSWINEHQYKTYIFIGNEYSDAIKNILLKLSNLNSNTGTITTSEKQKLLETFGSNYEQILGFNDINNTNGSVSFIYTSIYADDNVSWLKKKLFAHLHNDLELVSHDSIYMWMNKKLHISDSLLQTFLTDCFQTDKRISYDVFETSVLNFFSIAIPKRELQFIDKSQALAFLKKDVSSSFKNTEPIFFKYANDIYLEHLNYNPLLETSSSFSQIQNVMHSIDTLNQKTFDALLLETLGISLIYDDCFNLISVKNMHNMLKNSTLSSQQKNKVMEKYFPQHQEKKSSDYQLNTLKFVGAIEVAESKIQNHKLSEGHILGSYINFLHLRVNEINFNRKQDLEILFENITTSQDMPFIKYKALNNNYYKVHKESIVSLKNQLLGKWTENKISQYGKPNDTSYILIKLQYTKNVYCSLLLFDNLCYDVKFSFGNIMKETEKDVSKFLTKIDSIITKIQTLYPTAYIPLVDKNYALINVNDSNTKVLRWLTSNNIKSDKHNLNYSNFTKVVHNRFFTYFNIIRNPNKNILHLQYKKIDNYLKYENIQVFITNNFVKDKNEMLKKLTNEFVMSKEDAEKEYDRWLSQNALEILKVGDKVFIKQKNDNFVNVKIRLTSSVDMNFNIEGAKSKVIQDRIVKLLLIIMDMSTEKNIEKNEGLASKVDGFLFGNNSIRKSPSTSPSIKKVSTKPSILFEVNGDDFDEFEEFEGINDFGNYDEFGEFGDDDDLKALELEFLKDASQNDNEQFNKQNKKTGKKGNNDIDDDEVDGDDEESVMKSYFMNMLKSADRELIDYKVPKSDKSQKSYSRVCQWNGKRQPVVINKEELDKVQTFTKDIKYIKTGSTPELQEKNYYICPQVWCPKSKIALTYKDFKNKYNEACPYPEIEEKPILLVNNYWGKGEEGLNREHFPGYLDAFTHPKKYCLPCCFKKEAKEGSKNKQKENTCSNQWNTDQSIDAEPEIVGNEKYIKAEFVVPLEMSRFGLLPKEFNELLGNQSCGNGTDGKGLMNDKTNCILRKGINQKSQSFINALLFLLDNPKITSVSSFLNQFNQHVTVERFIGLENGKVMKLFINREYDIYNGDNFKSFIKWFIHSKQANYIKLYKLQDIFDILSALPLKSQLFNVELPKSKIIIREFLIYNAYLHFLEYMNNNNVEKNFNLIIDFVQTENKWLNTKNYNIVVIEHEPTENKTHMICPFNRNAKTLYDLTDPFVFIFKQNNYYEPLCHVVVKNGDLMVRTNFLLKTSPESIKRLIQFYMQNCTKNDTLHSAQDVQLFLKSLGFITKRYVIDYTFRVCGFLIKNNNLFIPIKNKLDVYDLNNAQFIYYDEIPNHKCTLSASQIEYVFKMLYKHTSDTFYKLNTIIMSQNDSRVVGLILNTDYFVPVNYIENEDIKYVNEIIEDDLNIFIENEKVDARKLRMQNDNNKKQMMKNFTSTISDILSKNKTLQAEYNFLIEPSNPFPVSYKRQMMIKLVNSILKESKFFKDINETNNTMHFINQYVEDIIASSNGKIHNVLLKQMFGIKKKFKKGPNELLFDQKDLIDGKLEEKIKFIQNPYTALMERLDHHMRDYMLELHDFDELDYFKRYINNNTVYEDVPYKFRKILPDYLLITYDLYTIHTMYDIFLRISKARGVVSITDMNILRNVVIKQIGEAFKQNDISMLYENSSYEYNQKVMRLKGNTLENIYTIIDSMNYYPSFFELRVLSEIARINVIVIGRKRKNNNEGIEIYHNNSTHYLLLEHSYDRFNFRDVFKVVIKGAKTKIPKILFRKHELSKPLVNVIENSKGLL